MIPLDYHQCEVDLLLHQDNEQRRAGVVCRQPKLGLGLSLSAGRAARDVAVQNTETE
jgi:hypothetical protein